MYHMNIYDLFNWNFRRAVAVRKRKKNSGDENMQSSFEVLRKSV